MHRPKRSSPTGATGASRMHRPGLELGLLLGLVLCGCPRVTDNLNEVTPREPRDALSAARTAPPVFVEVTESLGLDFQHQAGAYRDHQMPAIMGGGAAIFDANGDGRLDLYLINSGSSDNAKTGGRTQGGINRLFLQDENGRFHDATETSGLGDRGFGMGCAVGDVDNDGDTDVYVTNWGPDAFYYNEGDGTFTDGTARLGLGNDGWSTSATFFDYDRDGYLDLYVARYVRFDPDHTCALESGEAEFCGPTAFPGVFDLLYHNEAGQRFVDVTTAAGIATVRDAGLGVVAADFDDDGWVDVYVANDADANNLWRNQGNGEFVDDAVLLGAAYNQHGLSEAGMGVCAADVDEDGDLDLWVTHLIQESNTYYENLGEHGFVDQSAASGLGLPSLDYTGFGTALFDFDNDGDLDAAVVNGAVKSRPVSLASAPHGFFQRYVEPNLLLENRGNARFAEANERGGDFTRRLEVSRGLIPADWDLDGDLDLLVTNVEGPARLYRNEEGHVQSWIGVRAWDPSLRREALGAKVTILTARGRYVRYAIPTGGYLTSSYGSIHLGLGQVEEVQGFEVRWPDGSQEHFPGSPARRIVELHKGTGKPSQRAAADND